MFSSAEDLDENIAGINGSMARLHSCEQPYEDRVTVAFTSSARADRHSHVPGPSKPVQNCRCGEGTVPVCRQTSIPCLERVGMPKYPALQVSNKDSQERFEFVEPGCRPVVLYWRKHRRKTDLPLHPAKRSPSPLPRLETFLLILLCHQVMMSQGQDYHH